jgi:DNA-binding NarL/FixJ family response regulator
MGRESAMNERSRPVGETYSLGSKELHVLKLIAEGHSDNEIAYELGVTIETIRKNVASILHKMDTDSRTRAAIKAIKQGILNDTP